MQRWFWIGIIVMSGILVVGTIAQRTRASNQAHAEATAQAQAQATAQAQAEATAQAQATALERMLPTDYTQKLRYVALGDSTASGTGASRSKK